MSLKDLKILKVINSSSFCLTVLNSEVIPSKMCFGGSQRNIVLFTDDMLFLNMVSHIADQNMTSFVLFFAFPLG